MKIIYMRFTGDDKKDGSTPVNAVASYERAAELAKDGDKVIHCTDPCEFYNDIPTTDS